MAGKFGYIINFVPSSYLADSIIFSPNDLPLSLLTLSTGSLLVALRSHHVTYTLLPDAAISASCELDFGVLLKFILLPNVLPPSVDALNITSSFPVLLDHHTMYTLLSPDVAIGAHDLSPVDVSIRAVAAWNVVEDIKTIADASAAIVAASFV